MNRDTIHLKIDELLSLLSIHNSRLSLHTEKLSQLDIDVLRKQCIDLYDQVNMLALQGKIIHKTEPPKPVAKETPALPIESHHIEVAAPVVYIPQPIAQTTPTTDVPKTVEVPKKVVEATPEIVAAPPVVQVPASAIPSPPAPKPRKRDAVDQEIQSLFEKFSSHPIESIPRAISIAKRFEFQSEFFDGDAQAYNKFMQDVDAAGSRDAAFEVYHAAKAKYTWENDDLRDELKALLYRKYV